MLKQMTVLFSALLLPTSLMAQEEAASVSESGDKVGLEAGLDIAYASFTTGYNADGDSADLPDDFQPTNLLFNLNAEYAVAPVEGLSLGLDLPFTQFKPGSDIDAETGLGDVSIYGQYMVGVNETLNAGGRLRGKLATGDWEKGLGSGHTNIQISGLVDGNFSGAVVEGEVGYIMSMAADTIVDKYNPGDLIYLNAGFGYQVNEMITPKLNVNFAKGMEDSVDGTSAPDTGRQWLGLGLDVDIKINDMLAAHVGWGGMYDGLGTNLPAPGLLLMGKNTAGGVANVMAGIRGNF